MSSPIPGAFLLLSHELLMIREVFIVETVTQLVSVGVGCDAFKLVDRSNWSKDLSEGGWQCPARRVIATPLT